jgi:hypothetical protein
LRNLGIEGFRNSIGRIHSIPKSAIRNPKLRGPEPELVLVLTIKSGIDNKTFC